MTGAWIGAFVGLGYLYVSTFGWIFTLYDGYLPCMNVLAIFSRVV